MKLKLRSVGTSTGVLLPKEMLVRLKVKKDDMLFAIENAGRISCLHPTTPRWNDNWTKGPRVHGEVSRHLPRVGQVSATATKSTVDRSESAASAA